MCIDPGVVHAIGLGCKIDVRFRQMQAPRGHGHAVARKGHAPQLLHWERHVAGSGVRRLGICDGGKGTGLVVISASVVIGREYLFSGTNTQWYNVPRVACGCVLGEIRATRRAKTEG